MKYCILGGGGSFGLHTADFLLQQPNTELVMSVGRDLPKPWCFSRGIGDNDARYHYLVYHVTYQHYALLQKLEEYKPEVIINFAAQGESATSYQQSWRYFETNCVGLSRLIEALKDKYWLKRFLHVSTSELYGPAINGPATEEASFNPTSPYALSKLAFDQYLVMQRDKINFPMNILRPSNCYGEGQQLHRIIPKAYLYGLTGQRLPLHGGGRAEKSFMHSQDLANAIWLIANYADLGKIYNAGPAAPTSIRDVVTMVASSIGIPFDQLCLVTEDREHQDSRYWLSSAKINNDLKWQTVVNWEEGLERMKKWATSSLFELAKQPVDFVMRP